MRVHKTFIFSQQNEKNTRNFKKVLKNKNLCVITGLEAESPKFCFKEKIKKAFSSSFFVFFKVCRLMKFQKGY